VHLLPFLWSATAGGALGDETLEFPPQLEQLHLVADVDVGNHDAAPRMNQDQALARQALQRFPYRRTADSQRFA
jgi:hypothetical protein